MNVDYEHLSPMMKLYIDTKKEYKDCILFYRLGDFYEMFFEDALTASKELEITLTGKQCGLEERAPMCGVPYHAVNGYLDKLVGKGYKVAICEQVEDPKMAKGLVKREVVRIVTPGTNISDNGINREKNNYLMSVSYTTDNLGVSVVDVSTGDYYLTEVESIRNLMDEIVKYSPAELICNEALLMSGIDVEDLRGRLNIAITTMEPHYFDEDRCKNVIAKHFGVNGIAGLGISDFPNGILAAGSLLQYLIDTQKNDLSHITHLYPYIADTYMLLDSSTRRNLELTETLREKQKRGSLLWVLDKCKTAMGSRTLAGFVRQPLVNRNDIEKRLSAVEALCKNPVERDEIREYLNSVYDLERLAGKISFGTVNARDMLALKSSLSYLPAIKLIAGEFESELLKSISEQIDDLGDIYTLIDEAIAEEPPLTIREGGIIRTGYNNDVDELRKAKTNGKEWLAGFESSEQERLGIKNLRVKYNKVFGYYIEISNSNKDKAPEDYIRKQTLTNAERFTNARLKELEDTILNAEDKLTTLEYDLFVEIRDYIGSKIRLIQQTAKAVAAMDVFASLSLVAEQNRYVRPATNEKGIIEIKEGRHPVVEKMIDNDMFVCNDTHLDNGKNLIAVITGPNMAGKSTYMRQVALITLMTQIGSFVPASKANIGITDRIFTRVGASDDLASGQSTFMVEMNEVANILRNATGKSLIILDEIGRGTSTFDGLSIAWAVIEHIANTKILGAKTLFATHYHELNEMENSFMRVRNYNVSIKEFNNKVIFLRKLRRGGSEHSFGIHVARMAGMPKSVVTRAGEILKELEQSHEKQELTKPIAQLADHREGMQLSFFQLDDPVLKQIRDEILDLDLDNLTPVEALNRLYNIKKYLK